MENNLFSNSSNRRLVTVVLLMVVISLCAYTYYTWQQAKYLYTGPTTISVSGNGEVMSVPDIGEFSFSVLAEGVDATKAQEASGTKINDILAALKEAGVAEKDIKTENYNLSPKYKYEQKPCPMGSYCPSEQVADGFEVTQTVRVKVRDLDNAGKLLALAGEKGSTNISSLQFTIDEPEIFKDEARSLAISDAKEKAKILAKELDVRLVKMVGYYEDEGSMPYSSYGASADMMMKSEAASFEAPEVPTGENKTTSRVTITYQVK